MLSAHWHPTARWLAPPMPPVGLGPAPLSLDREPSPGTRRCLDERSSDPGGCRIDGKNGVLRRSVLGGTPELATGRRSFEDSVADLAQLIGRHAASGQGTGGRSAGDRPRFRIAREWALDRAGLGGGRQRRVGFGSRPRLVVRRRWPAR